MPHGNEREVLADLLVPEPAIYWTDLVLSAGGGWAAFALALVAPPAAAIALTAVSVLLLYRALCFMHEISHHRTRLPRFEAAWNLLIGYPMLSPASTYAEVHFDHHRAATYGTSADPEYLPFARSIWLSMAFCLHSLLIPFVLALRFLVLGPIALAVPALERVLIARASALAINPHYRRTHTPSLRAALRRDQAFVLALWTAVLMLIGAGVLPLRLLLLWLLIFAVIAAINALRTLAAHVYESDGQVMDRAGQRADSIDIPGGLLTELWAPLGLRYHALHHRFPGVPYHALPRAYRRLAAASPEQHAATTGPGLFACVWTLLRKGSRRQADAGLKLGSQSRSGRERAVPIDLSRADTG